MTELALAQAWLVLLAGSIQLGSARDGPPGYVLAAPHDGYDRHTGDLLARIRERLDWGWVVATGYRSSRSQEWFDVNRPTARPWVRGKFGATREQGDAREVYESYQAALREAGQIEADQPLRLLVELHGHDRKVERDGRELRVDVIELTSQGFDDRALRKLQRRYERLVAEHVPEALRVPLAIEQLQPTYTYAGGSIPFKYGASGAKASGSLRPECAQRALHIELPGCVRLSEEARGVYAQVFAELFGSLD